jgi:transaldolase
MQSPIQSLIATGTKLWLDSVDPDLIRINRELGATGATSNPIIIADLIKSGRFDAELQRLLVERRLTDEEIAWQLADGAVQSAQKVFLPVWNSSHGDDGYVSFELDPLLEDPASPLSHQDRVARYVELGRRWSAGHDNRMIKVPATPAGLDALEELAAAGVALNVTLIFTLRQYEAARDAIWRGAQRRKSLDRFKSVYSIFISRVDVYTLEHVPKLSAAAQGLVGIIGAKRMWLANQRFWKSRPTPLQQEIVFASTGTKNKNDPPWKYVIALAGSDIQTNPPATNDAVEASGLVFERTVDELPPTSVLDEIDAKVNVQAMEDRLMREGVKKFAEPQQQLLKLISEKRRTIAIRTGAH